MYNVLYNPKYICPRLRVSASVGPLQSAEGGPPVQVYATDCVIKFTTIDPSWHADASRVGRWLYILDPSIGVYRPIGEKVGRWADQPAPSRELPVGRDFTLATPAIREQIVAGLIRVAQAKIAAKKG